MKTKKLSAVLAVSTALTLILGACSGKGEQSQSPSSSAPAASPGETAKASDKPAEKTKIIYWTAGRHDADYVKSAIDKFNASNPDNIEVEMTIMAENFAQSLDLAFASNQAPDVFSATDVIDHSKKGYLEPLNNYLTPEIKTQFGDRAFIEGYNMVDGNIYSLPNSGSTLRLVYNAEAFEKAGIASPPKSLAEMVDAAKKITEVGKKDGLYGFALPYKNPASALGRSAVPIAELSGVPGQGYDFKTGKFDFAGYKPVIDAFKEMKDNGSTLPGSESLDIDPLRAQFAEGKIGMYLSYSSEPGVYKNQFPIKIKWDAALPPTIDGTYKGIVNQGVGASRWLALSSKSANKEAAWKFMSYMYSEEVLIGYQENGLGILSVPSVAQKANKPDIAGIENFLPGEYDGMWPAAPQGFSPEGKTWQEEFMKYILVGGDFDSIAQDLNTRYNAALDKEKAAGTIKAEPMPDFDPIKLQGAAQ